MKFLKSNTISDNTYYKKQQSINQNIFSMIGTAMLELIRYLGSLSIFTLQVVLEILKGRYYFKILLKQILEIGFFSLPVIGLTAIFTGAVLALQSYTGFARMNAEGVIASVVVLSITRELGPVLAGLMVAGRLGSSIAAELATMKVTEQIDALYTLNTNPINYLVVPRVIAGLLMLPFLVLITDVIGVFGGYLISIYKLGFSPSLYLKNTFNFLKIDDVMLGLIKAMVFGFFISLISCHQGYIAKGGAQGVGKATTQAVVISSIIILLMDYIITGLLFIK